MSELVIKNLTHFFGGLIAVNHFNLQIKSGEIVGIIGPNGAGKTTVFNLLCGIYTPQQGSITLDKQALVGLSMFQINRHGIARTFQNIRLFKQLSVLENVLVAIQSPATLTDVLIGRFAFHQAEQLMLKTANELLARFDLMPYANQYAGQLSYGLQRRLEIVRALATKPAVLLLDEPACGMNFQEIQSLSRLIQNIQQTQQLAILLIDHQMQFVMSLCQRIYVLNFGETIAMGDPNTICQNPQVVESYLGKNVNN